MENYEKVGHDSAISCLLNLDVNSCTLQIVSLATCQIAVGIIVPNWKVKKIVRRSNQPDVDMTCTMGRRK